MNKSSKEYTKACDAIREVYRKGDSEELLALRYLAGSLADDLVEIERASSQQADSADPIKLADDRESEGKLRFMFPRFPQV